MGGCVAICNVSARSRARCRRSRVCSAGGSGAEEVWRAWCGVRGGVGSVAVKMGCLGSVWCSSSACTCRTLLRVEEPGVGRLQ